MKQDSIKVSMLYKITLILNFIILSLTSLSTDLTNCYKSLATLHGQPDAWSSELTTPVSQHDPDKFVYIVHGMGSLYESIVHQGKDKSIVTDSIWENPDLLLEEAELAVSLITPERSGTYTASGLILKLAEPGNVMAAFHYDLGLSNMLMEPATEQYIQRTTRANKAKKIFQSPLEVLSNTGKLPDKDLFETGYPPTYNELRLATTGPGGGEIEIEGLFLKIDEDGKPRVGPLTLMRLKRLSKILDVPIIPLHGYVAGKKEGSHKANTISTLYLNESVTNLYNDAFGANSELKPELQAVYQEMKPSIDLSHDNEKVGQTLSFQSEEEVKSGKVIGSGYQSVVIGVGSEKKAYKLARSWQQMPALFIEAVLYESLSTDNHYSLSEHLVPIEAVGELGSYLVRPLLPPNRLGSDLAGSLSTQQKKQLKILYQKGKELAEKSGIALDLKSSNLHWDGKKWMLLDLGPRRSHRPYAYTSDPPNFDAYLKVWNTEEPPDNPGFKYTDSLRKPY